MSRCYPSGGGAPCTPPRNHRADCSGFVSMAFGLGASLVTGDMVQSWFGMSIGKNDLQQGDLMVNPGAGGAGHVAIFDRWVDAAHTQYMAYEQTGSQDTIYRAVPYPVLQRLPDVAVPVPEHRPVGGGCSITGCVVRMVRGRSSGRLGCPG